MDELAVNVGDALSVVSVIDVPVVVEVVVVVVVVVEVDVVTVDVVDDVVVDVSSTLSQLLVAVPMYPGAHSQPPPESLAVAFDLT